MRIASTVKTIDYKTKENFYRHCDTMRKNGWSLINEFPLDGDKYKYCGVWGKGPCV